VLEERFRFFVKSKKMEQTICQKNNISSLIELDPVLKNTHPLVFENR